jgi:quercetin dioxygenase-like cupin family protein
MKKTMLATAACTLAVLALATVHRLGAAPEAVMLSAQDLKWGPAPPVLPKGAQVAILRGDPNKKGTFALRMKVPDGYKIPPHWHSNDEELTIVSGTFLLSMGDKAGENVHTLEPGAYHFLPAKMHHAAAAKGEVILQLQGPGPFDIHYLNPADDPSKKTAAK